MFEIGRYRYDRLRQLNPNLPIPSSNSRPNYKRISAEQKELIRLFMLNQATEPGYPCQHRAIPIYMEDPNVTFASLYMDYKVECEARDQRELSRPSFVRVVKFLMPTLHLGRTKTDVCNACFSLDLQIKNPETSEALKHELKEAKKVHLDEAIVTRRAINKLVKSVKEEVAPSDPPFLEEPIYIPQCVKDPFDRLNRPFVIDVVNGTIGTLEEEEEDETDRYDNYIEDDKEDQEVSVADEINNDRRRLRVSIQDYGAGIPLPHYGASQPNHDYYASNLTLNNMNFVDCGTGTCHIYYYDERTAGKDGNCVSSIRWREIQEYMRENRDSPPRAECKVLDNCVGQNKSNTTHKFSMLLSLLIFPDGVKDIYFKVGHSHNQSDMKTAHAKKALAKKNLYTPQAVIKEVNTVKGLVGQLIESRDMVFQDWKTFLDKHFPNMDIGFTSFFIFEFKNGIVKYQELDKDGEVLTVKSKTFCADPESTKKIVLRELLNLSSTSSLEEICQSKPRLPPLPERRISQKKIDNMKILYQQIPRSSRWYYPEGESVEDESHADLRSRVVQAVEAPGVEQQDHVEDGGRVGAQHSRVEGRRSPVAGIEGGRRSVGRPKKLPSHVKNQPAIHRFFGSVNVDFSDESIDDESGKGGKEANDKDEEDGGENSESSDDERFDLPYNEEFSTPGIVKERVEKDTGDSGSSDSEEVTVPLKKIRRIVSDESDDDEFEIQFEGEAGGNDRGDSELLEVEASGSVDGGGGRVEYVSDINHNAEKIVIKLRKK